MDNQPLDGGILVNTDYLEMTIREWPWLIDEDETLTEAQIDAIGEQIVKEAVERGDLREKIKDAVFESDVWGRLTDLVDDVVWDYVRERAKEVRQELGLIAPSSLSREATHL